MIHHTCTARRDLYREFSPGPSDVALPMEASSLQLAPADWQHQHEIVFERQTIDYAVNWKYYAVN